jgi:pimeloyl-ACP methyl ester carboxylesterase
MWGDPRRVTKETLEGYSRPLVRRGIFEHAVGIVRTWHADMAKLEAALPRLAPIPVLLVWGSKDRVVDLASSARIKQHLPHAEIALIEGAGHLPYEECPEAFCRIIEDFLKKQEMPSRARSTREVT